MDDHTTPLTDVEVATQLYQLITHIESQVNREDTSTNWLMKRSLSHLAKSLLFYSMATRQQPVNINLPISQPDKPISSDRVDPKKHGVDGWE